MTSAVPKVPACGFLNSQCERRGGSGSKITFRAIDRLDAHRQCRCGDVGCLDGKARVSIALLGRRVGRGPEGVLKSVDTDMPTPVKESQKGGHVQEGVLNILDTDMPTPVKERRQEERNIVTRVCSLLRC